MEYEVVYSGRKTVSLCIKEGKLIVKAPYKTPKSRIDGLVASHKGWIEKHLEKQKEKNERIGELTPERIEELRALAKKFLPMKTAYFASLMGVTYGKITITGAKTRFGSCNSKGNIAFSYRLMAFPEAAIDYVVVHELAHRIEMNHSKRFYAVVARIMPDYKARAKLLK